MNRARLAVGAALLLAALLAGPGRTAPPARKALVLLSANSGPYKEMLAGFTAQFHGPTEVLIAADDATVAARLTDPPGLVFVLGSGAADQALRLNCRGPVLFGMVYYPEEHGLTGRENVAGLSLRVPPEKALASLDLVRLDPGRKLRVGVVYAEGREGPELAEIRAALERAGHQLVLERVAAGRDPGPAFAALLPRIDVLWLVADPSVITGPEFLSSILRAALDRKVAVIGLSESHVRAGALLAVSVDYRLEGQSAARLAERLVAGEKPAAIGIVPPQNLVQSLNVKVAEELGWPVLRSARQRFERVYP